MGILKIDYSDLEKAGKQAEKAADDLEDYAKALDKKVSTKISGISGGSTTYVSNALYFVNNKISALNSKADKLDQFAGSLDTLCEHVKAADEKIDKQIDQDYKTVKKDQDIKVNCVTEFFSWLGTSVLNSTAFGRWINTIVNKIGDFAGDIWGEIRYWYNCEGGKYWVDIAVSVLAIIGAIAVICIGGAGFIAICGIIGAYLTIANGLNNIGTSIYALTQFGDDPAWANRYGKMDKASQTLRNTINNKYTNALADVLDFTEAFTDIVGVVDLGKTVIKGNKHMTALKKLFGDKDKGLGSKFLRKVTAGKEDVYIVTFEGFCDGMKSLTTNKGFRDSLWKNFKKDLRKDFKSFAFWKNYKSIEFDDIPEAIFDAVKGNNKDWKEIKSITKNNFKQVYKDIKEFIKPQLDGAWKQYGEINKHKAVFKFGKTEFTPFWDKLVKGGAKLNEVYKVATGNFINMDSLKEGGSPIKLRTLEMNFATGTGDAFGFGDKDSIYTKFVNIFKSESDK
jgi:hypothetical protein